MSENIRGITFAEQTVTPADDAIVRRAMLSDGILSGCNITYSGSTLTMAAGYVIACGRAFQITAAQNWAVVDATSGFARLLLTIDLTKTATEAAFNQIDFSVEYASAENGFVDIVQDDINNAGTKYQIVIAVVSLGTGGITGIVSKLEKAEGGGGGGLNFKVVAGLTQPGSATENTIWAMAENMTGWIFSASEPAEPVEGMVWISTGTGSPVEFNALKKNGIQVYPLYAKQYVGSAWVDVTAMSYQGGEWVDWIRYLLNIVPVVEWQSRAWRYSSSSYTAAEPTVEKTADGMKVTISENHTGAYEVVEDVDLTDIKTITATIEAVHSGKQIYFAVGERDSSYANGNVTKADVVAGDLAIDVSSLSGPYDIYFYFGSPGSFTVSKVRMD